jgi:hypothetical protein
LDAASILTAQASEAQPALIPAAAPIETERPPAALEQRPEPSDRLLRFDPTGSAS